MIITTTPTNLLAEQSSGARWLVQNLGPEAVFVARSQGTCTPTAGLKVGKGEAISLDVPVRKYNGGSLWARSESNTADVRIMRVG